MRGAAARALLAGALVLAPGGCRDGWLLGPLDHGAAPGARDLTWSALDAGEVEVIEDRSRGAVRYRLRLPEGTAGADLRRLDVSFQRPLDGARVDVRGAGPRHALTLLHGRRIGGDTVAIPLAPALTDVDLVVHHHLRPVPLLARIRAGRAAP
jgi:hypothetical protein